MLLLTCASLQPQATPSWLPGSLHEPRSQATSSDMRNLAHQPGKFCLALGPAPPRLLLLVPISVLFGSSSPETLKFEERGGRPNYKMCWWSAKTKTKFCSFIVVSNDRQRFYKHTCPTNMIHFSDQPSDLNNPQMFVSTTTTTVIHSRKKACDSGTPSVTDFEDSLYFVSAVSMSPAYRVRFQTRSEEQEAGLFVLSWRPQIQNAHTPTIAIPTSHSALDPTQNHKRNVTLKFKIVLCSSFLPRFGTRNWIHHLRHCCEEQSKEWTAGWQKKDR